MKKHIRQGLAAAGVIPAAVLMLGCGASQPAEQLVDARHTYEEISQGKAQEYAPDELLEADNLLDQAAEEKNGSTEQIHFAYLAERQARLARSSGTIEYYQEEANRAQSQYISELESRSQSAQERLESTREELSEVTEKMKEKDANVEQLQSRKAELEQRRQQLEEQLNEKESALNEAEARAEAALASLNKLAKVQEDGKNMVITLSGSVLFETGKAKLLPLAENRLKKVADAIGGMDDDKQIVIEGHTDSRGQESMNQKLSQQRAQSVLDFLSQQGVDTSRMKAVGKGESEPIATNDSPEGRANNRRVELHIKESPGQKSAQAQQANPEAG